MTTFYYWHFLQFCFLNFWPFLAQKAKISKTSFKKNVNNKKCPLNHNFLQSTEKNWKFFIFRNFGLFLANFLALMAEKCLQLKIYFIIPHLPPYMWKWSKSLWQEVYLVLCTRLEIRVSLGGGYGGRLGQSFCVGYKGR